MVETEGKEKLKFSVEISVALKKLLKIETPQLECERVRVENTHQLASSHKSLQSSHLELHRER